MRARYIKKEKKNYLKIGEGLVVVYVLGKYYIGTGLGRGRGRHSGEGK